MENFKHNFYSCCEMMKRLSISLYLFITFCAGIYLWILAFWYGQEIKDYTVLGFILLLGSQAFNFKRFNFFGLSGEAHQLKEAVDHSLEYLKELIYVQSRLNVDCMSKIGKLKSYSNQEQLNNLNEIVPILRKLQVTPNKILNLKEVVYKQLYIEKIQAPIIMDIHAEHNDRLTVYRSDQNKCRELQKIHEEDSEKIIYISTSKKCNEISIEVLENLINNLKSVGEDLKTKFKTRVVQDLIEFKRTIQGYDNQLDDNI